MKPLSTAARRDPRDDEHERRHYALLIETLSKKGRSEDEITRAVGQAMRADRRTVLLAEDDAVTRLDLRRIVERAGYRVCDETGNGRQAVALALEHRPDLVVMDVGMPRMDGVEAARQIGAGEPIPIVLLTGYGYGDVVASAIDAGVSAFVAKPFQEAALLDAMQAALDRRPNDVGLAYLRLADG